MRRALPTIAVLAGVLLFTSFDLSGAQFYQGKTLRITVGHSAGGGFDLWARVVARHIGKHIPGKPDVIVDNITGTGGLIHVTQLFGSTKPDGLTIGHFNGSGTFYKGTPNFLHYVVSKGGNVAITRAMAREVGDAGICVNAIAPGFTVTDYLKEHPMDGPEVHKSIIASQCIKRVQTPDDLTGTIVYLASDDSDFVTGQTILVDGGSALN
jgi:NAD(P)-dependent dehydrogenase (short-subunit alcohol dehydrogenase family)